MKMRSLFVSVLVSTLLIINSVQLSQGQTKTFTYYGMCDGSAGTAIDEKTFIVASDETRLILPPSKKGENVLNVYEIDNSTLKYSVDLEPALKTKDEDNEADIEGSARIGNRIFWITSHGLNKNGKLREDRLNFFATDIVNGKAVLASKEGQILPAYDKLLINLIADSRYEKFGFNKLNDLKIAPEAGGVNIEGLTATPDGKLFISFRSPLIEGKSLIAVLENPNEVIEGKPAKFGEPIQLNLNNLGIRDMAYWSQEQTYLIIAGSVADSDQFYLYKWSGKTSDKPVKLNYVDFSGFNPEAIIIYPSGKLQILSDDGSIKKSSLKGNILENKELPDAERSFRGIWVSKLTDWMLEK